MDYTHAERLSALDNSFLALEDPNAHMHIGAVALFDGAALAGAGGGVDLDRMRRLLEAGLHRVPRYRQRIGRIPLFNHPVWVDDERFDLAYHLRHTRLPAPGDERQLKRLAGRIMSQPLDRTKPLWETWVVEGVEGNRVGLVTKAHHCMIDGVGSVELTGTIMRPTPDPDPRLEEPAPRWTPRPAPSASRLVASEISRRAFDALGSVLRVRDVVADPRGALRGAMEAARGVGEALAAGLRPASPTPLNVHIGPHRRFDWTSMDLGALKTIRAALGGTLNDVVLAIVAGALRRFLYRRGLRVDDLDFRAMVPVNVRRQAERDHLGNRVAMMVARLPVGEHDARTRLERVMHETAALKRSHQAAGVQTIEELSDHSFTTLFTLFARVAAAARPFNLVVTNVPGPQFPVYVLGSQMLACYPLVPLYQNQALGIALFSYDGRLHWGFNADRDALPDVHDVVEAVEREFDGLLRLARGSAASAAA